MDSTRERGLSFFALGDWGKICKRGDELAAAMDSYARQTQRPAFVLALGDNFYPGGVDYVTDWQFKDVWEDVFLKYPSLRVPWQVILGNHDYMGNPQAQLDFTKHASNPDKLWVLPDKNYTFTRTLPSGKTVEFFGLDSNGAQGHVRESYPTVEQDLFQYKKWLEQKLASSTAHWKIVFAHHPMYTKSRKHGVIGRCLRDATYSDLDGRKYTGYDLEKSLVNGHVDAYFSGHEHVFQHHVAHGVHHFVCGAAGVEGISFFGGEDVNTHLDWYDKTVTKKGFASVTITDDTMEVTFIDTLCGPIAKFKVEKKHSH